MSIFFPSLYHQDFQVSFEAKKFIPWLFSRKKRMEGGIF